MSEQIKYLDDIGLKKYDSELKEYVNDVVDTKVDKINGKGLSTNDYTTEEKNKLANIENEANKTIVDSSLSSTSTNPVQNKVINEVLLEVSNMFEEHQSQIDSKASASMFDNYYTKTQIDSLELITIDEIDAICGQKIYMASEVEF